MTFGIVEQGGALRSAVADVRARILQSPDIPPAKRRELARLWDEPPRWTIRETALEPGIQARTDPTTHTITISAATITRAAADRPGARDRLRAIVFHELIHATGERELDAEVLENLVYARAGATPPTLADVGVVAPDGHLIQGPEAFSPREADPWAPAVGDHFVWDPRTGEVRRRGADGLPTGAPVLRGKGWKRQRVTVRPSGTYRLGSFEFDPLHLRVSTIASPGRPATPVLTSPHFVIALFAALEAAEAARAPTARRRGVPFILTLRDATLAAPAVPAAPRRRRPG